MQLLKDKTPMQATRWFQAARRFLAGFTVLIERRLVPMPAR